MKDKKEGLAVNESFNECNRLKTQIAKRTEALLKCNTYSYLSTEERIAVLLDVSLTKVASGNQTQEDELDVICYMMLIRAYRRLKMAARWRNDMEGAIIKAASQKAIEEIQATEDRNFYQHIKEANEDAPR